MPPMRSVYPRWYLRGVISVAHSSETHRTVVFSQDYQIYISKQDQV